MVADCINNCRKANRAGEENKIGHIWLPTTPAAEQGAATSYHWPSSRRGCSSSSTLTQTTLSSSHHARAVTSSEPALFVSSWQRCHRVASASSAAERSRRTQRLLTRLTGLPLLHRLPSRAASCRSDCRRRPRRCSVLSAAAGNAAAASAGACSLASSRVGATIPTPTWQRDRKSRHWTSSRGSGPDASACCRAAGSGESSGSCSAKGWRVGWQSDDCKAKQPWPRRRKAASTAGKIQHGDPMHAPVAHMPHQAQGPRDAAAPNSVPQHGTATHECVGAAALQQGRTSSTSLSNGC